ncbi:MAG: tyrosine-type recombinase/integrase [Prevotella sp.]|nr:tyrosine-type recombinase/integrase [Prevotella sp.]
MKQFQKSKNITLLQAFDLDNQQFSVRVGKDRSWHSYNIKVRARNYVSDFLLSWEHRQDIPLSSLQLDFIQRFSTYLSVERGLRGGTIWLNCMMLKGVVQRAHKRGLIKSSPFAEFHIAKNIRERQYLSEEELHQLMKFHFTDPMQAYTRDLFVFSALTGMSYIDIRGLKKSDVFEIDGYEWIITSRHKTGIPFKVRLLTQALLILKRYTKDDKDDIFDLLEYHAIAKRLRKVMKECGITKQITFHCARHTFATIALNHGMAIESVSSILGHSNIRTTQIYARITIRKLDSDFAKLENELSRSLPKTRLKSFYDTLKRIFSLLVKNSS